MKSSTIAVLSLCCASATCAANDDVSRIFRTASPSIVTVHAGDASSLRSQGSGFFISRKEIATNCHVLGFHPELRIKHGDKTLTAKLLRGDYAWDVCVLRVEEATATPLKVNLGVPDSSLVGRRVVAIGSPLGFELSVSEGIVSALRRKTPADLIQTTAAISPGSSGGPLLATNGEVIGITTSQIRDAQAINFAVSSYALKILGDDIRYWSPMALDLLLDLFDQRAFDAVLRGVDLLSRDTPPRLDRDFFLNLAEAARTEPLSPDDMARLVRELDKSLPFFAASALQMEKRTGSSGSSLAYVAPAVFRVLAYRKKMFNKSDERADDAWQDVVSLSLIQMTTELIRSFSSRGAEEVAQMKSGDDMLLYLDRALERTRKLTDRYPRSCSARTAHHALALFDARLKFVDSDVKSELARLRELLPSCPNSIGLHRVVYAYSRDQPQFADSIKRKVRQLRPASERELAFVEDQLQQASAYVRRRDPQME